MHKYIFIGFFAVSLLGTFLMSNAQAEDAIATSEVEVAAIEPGATLPKVTGKTLPTYLDEDLANRKDEFSRFAKTRIIPNLILTGPPGCGKTTSIHCLAREVLKENYSQA